jgi:hypothetical protein
MPGRSSIYILNSLFVTIIIIIIIIIIFEVKTVGFTTVVDIPHSTSVEVALSILYIISIL